MMKKLPIGEQNFRKIRENDMLYVDKTAHIHRLISELSYCFLSRPRRFGKSLTLSTIEEIFSGSRELFNGLWIENNWNWDKKNPVIHLSFSKLDYQNKGLEQALMDFLDEHAAKNNLTLFEKSAKSKLVELLEKLFQKNGQVVILIDEYDKPLIDYLDKESLPIAKQHRNILKTFYSGLKDNLSQAAMRFLLITGVSKFSQVSVFSDLNYLNDLTLHPHYGALVGYTQTELEFSFQEYIHSTVDHSNGVYTRESLLTDIKSWYNGYTWNLKDFVYIPFSILQFFSNGIFQDYWFKTGTPTFLMKVIKEQGFYNLNNLIVSNSIFDSYDLEYMDGRSLLFQTGYLTIKNIDYRRGLYTLDYPNREVEEAMQSHLIALLLHRLPADSSQPVIQLENAFFQNDIPKVITVINSMLKDLPSYVVHGKDEHFYHSLVHLHFRYLGLYMDSEVHTSDGRMDAVVQTPSHVFILEFKLDETADEAIQQIIQKHYADKYRLSGKQIIGVGINFDSATKSVGEWKEVEL